MNGSEQFGWIVYRVVGPQTVVHMRRDGGIERPQDPRLFFRTKQDARRAAGQLGFVNAEFAKAIMP